MLITAFAATIGGLVMNAYATDTNSTTADQSTTTSTSIASSATDLQFGGMGPMMMGDQGFGRGHGHGGPGFGGCFGNIELSSEYNQTISSILANDTDVQNLIAEGYNTTSTMPMIQNVIGADGTVTSKTTTAIVILQNGTSGIAEVKVNIEQAKVTQIIILTRTVIDKTTS